MDQGLLKQSGVEKMVRRSYAFFYEYRYAVLGALFCGLLAYTYAFTNKLVNWDELMYLFDKGATLESGRWGLVLLCLVFPNYSMPWIYGIISLFLITAAICLCLHTFCIRSGVLQFLVAGAMMTFPSMAATVSYTFTISAYAAALLLAIAAVYFLSRGGWKYAAAALLCSVVSVSIYQAYIAVTASLLILVLIQWVLQQERSEKTLFLTGLGYVLFLAAALGIYWVSARLAWQLSGTTVGSYADSALTMNRMDILHNVKNAYASSFRILVSGFYGLIATPASRVSHLLCGGILMAEVLLWMKRNPNPLRIALLVFLAALLPVSMNCMFLFVNDIMIHSLVMYGFTSLYVLTAIVLEQTQFLILAREGWNRIRKWSYDIVLLGMVVVIAGNIYFANKGYLNLHLQYEATHSFATTVITTLQNTPGFQADSRVALVGQYQRPRELEEQFSCLSGIYGLEGITPNTYSIAKLFEYYCGVKLNLVSAGGMAGNEEFARMPVYPAYGSVREIDGIFVVRLS